ncbi:MAG: hypothetical protein IT495_03115 [Gammaproteobacteria bacterium]|nr:hypothetical protein [Gammaproteobacteria bacterium]
MDRRDNDTRRLLDEIEAHCRRTATAESTFGRQAVNDGKLVARLRAGKSVTLRTLERVRTYMRASAAALPSAAETPVSGAAVVAARGTGAGPVRFYDSRQRYLAFVNACNEKPLIARRAARELQYVYPSPPALRVFDAGMGDATVLTLLMRELHRRFPVVPLVVTAKELSPEDVRLALEKMPDRFLEHPATVLIVTNLNYTEAPRLMLRDARDAAALNWHEVRLAGSSTGDYAEQIEALEPLLAEGWRTRLSPLSGNPVYERPSVLVLYRDDQRFLLDPFLPRPGHSDGLYDFVIASQPWRARAAAVTRARNILLPLVRSLAPGGRLLAIQSYGDDAGLALVQAVWPGENPFTVRRHEIVKALKDELGRDARAYNFNVLSDAKSILRFDMHSLPPAYIDEVGTSTLFSAWNAAIYVCQIEDERLEAALASGDALAATRATLRRHRGLWFNDESFVVSRHRD